uniref:Protein kinase domain-containing protein n=1 Tax=Ascaris lumbricoides TaxID=6252 RepID=A0A9J2PB26_ASCLU
MRCVPLVTQFVRLSIWALCSICTSVAAPGLPPDGLQQNAVQDDSMSSFSDHPVESSTRNTLLDFGVATITGIASWRNMLAVLTPDSIIWFELASDALSSRMPPREVGRVQLSAPLDLELLEFKFLSQSSIFVCDSFTCRLCWMNRGQTCTYYSLETKGRTNDHISQVSVTSTTNGGIALRYVNEDGDAAVLKYGSTDNSHKRVEPTQYADDVSIVTDHRVVGAFNRQGFSYFVGSARRPFEPLINSKIDLEATLTSVRITRICDKDATKNVESRIELALGCPHLGLYENVYATAAEYDEKSDRLTVAFHSSNDVLTSSGSLCLFQMGDINNAFENVWNNCQNTTFVESTDNYKAPQPKNCELDQLKSLAYRYGWLEQFNPFSGSLYAILPDSSGEILSLGHIQEDNALFALSTNGKLQRVKYVEVNCAGLYENCDALESASWSDPLECRWCAKATGGGKTVSPTDQCPDALVFDICPPYIEHVNPLPISHDSTRFEIYGDKFDRMHNLSIRACNQTCAVRIVEHNKLTCTLSMQFEHARGCTVSAEGQLGTHGPLRIFYIHSTTDKAIDSASTHGARSRSTRTLKAIASVIAVVILVVLIALIILLVRSVKDLEGSIQTPQVPKFLLIQSTEAFSATNLKNFALLYIAIVASAESNAYIGHNGSGYQLRRFNPYERLFLEIDPKLKIPLNELNIGDEIGKGNFGIVYKGTLRDSSGAIREVACKTIDSHNDGVVSGVSEFLREGLIMANFNHPNVAQLIGISLTNNNCPLIITDYLANGDLRHYIINPNNVSFMLRLTFGNLLDFGIQIAEGMTYLHEKKFIHRDLAARNCMLDANLRVKIADFGLSRDVSRCGMYEAVNKDRGIPIRWMPIESLEDQQLRHENFQYTFKGDVWAYGVVLWELATRGLIPYADLEMFEILRLLKNGHRLSKPKGCPDILYERVMLVCWMEDPQRRPTFYELKEMMQDVVCQLRQGISGSSLLNNHYERVSPRSAATTPIAYTKPIAGPIITDL